MIDPNLLLRLLLVQFVMDFLLQSDKMVANRKSNKRLVSIKANLIHSGLHALASYVVVMDWTNWVIPLVIFVSHFAIDCAKGKREGLVFFLLDQMLHLMVIVGLWIGMEGYYSEVKDLFSRVLEANRYWIILIAYVLMWKSASTLIKEFISKWTPQLNSKEETKITPLEILPKSKTVSNLENAGKWIGYIERTLIVTFVLAGCLEAIGFLLAAKSIFRYGDLKEAKDIKMTEYVLIGTLSSFVVAIVTGFLFKYILVAI